MEALLFYFGKVVICSCVMFLYYQLSLKDKTFHHYNRFYLLSAMLISLLLPLIRIDYFTVEVNSNVYQLINQIQNFNSVKSTNYDYIYFRIIFSALGLVSFYFVGRFFYGIIKIQQLKKQFQKESFDGINFYHTNLSEAPFSYFKNLFWKNTIVLNSEVGRQILKHEMVHIEQKHSFDKLFIEVITAVFWFNPFFHIIKKEINLIHEYLADKKAIKQSDTKAFAQMLLAGHFSGTQLPATSPFLSSNLKKRLKMLQKPKTKFGYARRIFALPVLFTLAFAYMVDAKNKEIEKTNIAIEEAVSEVQRDTLITQSVQEERRTEPKMYKRSEGEKKIAELSEKIQEKSSALQNMQPDSKEFKKHVDAINELSGKINKIANSDEFQRSATRIVVPFKGNTMSMKFDDMDIKKMTEYFNSDEWNDNVERLKDLKVEVPEMNFDFSDVQAPDIKVSINDTKWNPDMEMKASEKAKKMAEIAKKKAELEKKRAKLNEKRAKLDGERAKLEAERMTIEGNRNRVYFYSNSFRNNPDDLNLKISGDNIKIQNKGQTIITSGINNVSAIGDMKIYIDGKESTREEMEALKPETIKKMQVNKKTNAGKATGEIRIETKK
ncbi:M56 family metallopeptidase [Chryseobacterium sp.]|uniref:M56 family metallopeptidase n=1 Tax=Chryseobacterium sp. TaxID=1871047 RepID=UPI0025BE5296|nr:M56 family metallopeptidase [Chryseobacterium sp.]